MRVGLVRHFKVAHALPGGWVTARDLHEWLTDYQEALVLKPEGTGTLAGWDRCLTSDSRRAVVTAEVLFKGPIEVMPLLREFEFRPFTTGHLKLPVFVWRLLLRLSWLTGHRSQRAARDQFFERIRAISDLVQAEEGNILVVSHAGLMMYLAKELSRRGFTGPKFRVPENGKLYIFQR